jgi:hypothetical protein
MINMNIVFKRDFWVIVEQHHEIVKNEIMKNLQTWHHSVKIQRFKQL